jgi:uncharacterized protein involved in type VI secretion and phage assembly
MSDADQKRTYYGKYRGVVVNNIDLENRGRIQATVPDVTSLIPSTWAEASVPLGGGPPPMGIYVVPPIGANVWIEFEKGDPNYPVWTGCMWGFQAEVPTLALAGIPGDPNIVLQTTGQHTLMLTDVPGPTGGIMLKSATGSMIIVSDAGITITNGKGATITMIGNTITMNEGALTII